MDLRGRTILVTRTPEQSMELIAEIERLGGRAVLFPTIRIEDPLSWEACDEAIRNIRSYNSLAFTSTNAVRKFFGRFFVLGRTLPDLTGIDVHAVGAKTRRALEKQGASVTSIPDQFSAANLGQILRSESLRGRHVLLPQGSLTGNELAKTLTEQGAFVDTIVVYRTVETKEYEVAQVQGLLRDGAIDVITFTSPSAARNFLKVIPRKALNGRPIPSSIAVIGPTTAEAVTTLGFRVDIVARESTATGLVVAIAEFFEFFG